MGCGRRGEAGGNFCGGAIDIIRQPPPNKYRLRETLLKQGGPAGWAKDTNTSKEKTLEPRKEVLMVLMDRIDLSRTESITAVASPWDGGVLSDQKQSKKKQKPRTVISLKARWESGWCRDLVFLASLLSKSISPV